MAVDMKPAEVMWLGGCRIRECSKGQKHVFGTIFNTVTKWLTTVTAEGPFCPLKLLFVSKLEICLSYTSIMKSITYKSRKARSQYFRIGENYASKFIYNTVTLANNTVTIMMWRCCSWWCCIFWRKFQKNRTCWGCRENLTRNQDITSHSRGKTSVKHRNLRTKERTVVTVLRTTVCQRIFYQTHRFIEENIPHLCQLLSLFRTKMAGLQLLRWSRDHPMSTRMWWRHSANIVTVLYDTELWQLH